MNQLKIGVIGCGYWGPNLVRNFMDRPNSKVIMVADLRMDRLEYIKNNYPDIAITENYQDLFKQNLDAVVIATPPPSHYPIAKDCLPPGLHVMVEQPLT